MDDQRWSEVKAILAEVLESSAAERLPVLNRLCGDDAELRKAVESLLEVETRANELMNSAAVPGAALQRETMAPEQAPAPARQLKDWVGSRSAMFWIFLAADVLALCLYIFSGILIARYRNQTCDWGYDTPFQAGSWRVSGVDPKGPAAGKLQSGDQVLSLNGVPATATGIDAGVRSVLPGATYEIRVRRNQAIVTATLRFQIVRRSEAASDIATLGIVSLAFFLTAVVLGFLKPDQLVVRRGYMALLAQALVVGPKCLLYPCQSFLRGPAFVLFQSLDLLDGVHFALAYLFYCTMFEQVLDVRRWKYLLYLLFPLAALSTAQRGIADCGWRIPWLDAHPALAKLSYFDALPLASRSFYIVGPLSICVVIARNYLRVRAPEERRRARWIAFGSLAGILPYVLNRFAGPFLDPEIKRNVYDIAISASALIPIATGYAIYKHRLFDIRVVIRRGVRYVLARGVLQAALALPAIGLILALVGNAHRTVADAIWNNSWFLVLLALLAGVLKFRMPLTRWLDRRFFRESYSQEQVLVALIDSVQQLDSLSEMAQTVGQKLAGVFHPASIAILFRTYNDRMFSSAYCSGRAAGGLRLQENSLLAALEAGRRARQVGTIRGIPTQELRRLEMLQTDLMVPMNAGTSGLAGVVLLGRKLSEEPYTAEDRRLLTALAGQMGMVHENILLHQMLANQQRSAEELRSLLEANRIDTFRECPLCGRCYDLNVDLCADDGRPLAFSLPISRTVNRYLLARRIGKGGMGVIYEAEDLSLHRRVAVKIITRGIENPTGHQRAYREARTVARLNHPNIISTYDFGVMGDVAYLVMEFVAGETLRAFIAGGRVIDSAITAQWFDQILAGVEAAHRAGIVHRDLKPENILISAAPDGGPLVKILDFGIAKLTVPDLQQITSVTTPGTVMGTMQYMSPEQLNGGKVDERSDIFAIGIMAFEVITGRLPFSGKTYSEHVVSVLHGDISMPQISRSGRALESVLTKCLAKDPAARFATVAELRHYLIPLLNVSKELSAN